MTNTTYQIVATRQVLVNAETTGVGEVLGHLTVEHGKDGERNPRDILAMLDQRQADLILLEESDVETVDEEDDEEDEEEDTDQFSSLTLAQLQAKAVELNVDLTGVAKKKTTILAALRAAVAKNPS